MQSVEFESQGDRLRARLFGDIDHHNCTRLREQIDGQVTQYRPTELVLDFSRVTFLDSAGIGLILGRYRWMRSLGGTVSITGLQPKMEQVLLLSGIHRLIRMTPAPPPENSREIFSDSAKGVSYHAK